MIKVEHRGSDVFIVGNTYNTGHLLKQLAAWDATNRAWKVHAGKAMEARNLSNAINETRKRWPGGQADWWVGREDTEEAIAMVRRLEIPDGDRPRPKELSRARSLIKTNHWQFAKTMPKWPHYYTLRKNWGSEPDFLWFVSFIRRCGVVEMFGKIRNIYFYDAEWKYWSMGAPLADTILVNRAHTAKNEYKLLF